MHPIIFQTNFFTLHSLWLFLGVALLVSTYTLIKLSDRNSLKIQFLSENSIRIFICVIFIARITAVITNFSAYFYELSTNTLLQLFYIWDKGLSLWGGVLGLLIAMFLICKKSTDQNFFKWMDVIIPSIIIGLAIVHIGTFFDGIGYGKPTGLPWGVNFANPAVKYTVPIHPTQIYAFIYSTIIVSGLTLLSQTEKIKTIEPAGFIGLLGTVAYLFFSFMEEFLRGDDTYLLLGIRIPQIIIFLLLIAVAVIFYLRYYHKKIGITHFLTKQ